MEIFKKYSEWISVFVQDFKYAALQYGKQCFCASDRYDEYGMSNKCNMECAGDKKETCGGSWANQVYRTGEFMLHTDRGSFRSDRFSLFCAQFNRTLDPS